MGLGLVDKPHLRRFKNKLDTYLNNTFVKKTDKATTTNLGLVKPDGTTITVNSNGVISGSSSYELPTASTNTLGGVKIDGSTITIDNNGVISSTGGSGGSSVEWTQTQSSGTKIAEIEIDGTSQDVYAPTPTTVEANPQDTATDTLTKIQIGEDIYEVGSGGSSTLADLTDTDITTPSDNQDLVYDNTSSKWKNKTTRIELTKAEYDALSYAEKHNGCMYYITDVGHTSRFTPIGLGECYSTEEKMVGCWTDGKPLYQKTWVTANSTVGSEVNIDVSALSVDTCVAVFGEYTRVTGGNTIQYEFNNYENSSPTLFAWVRYTVYTKNITYVIRVYSGNGETTDYQHITMRYTKTTDTAGSGSWTPSGETAIHYSTDEQIIGTWVDGKTLYQKTIVVDNPTKTSGSNNKYCYDVGYSAGNIDFGTCIQCDVFDSQDQRWYHIPYNRQYNSEDIYGMLMVANHNYSCLIFFNNNQAYNLTKIIYTIQYTKTS